MRIEKNANFIDELIDSLDRSAVIEASIASKIVLALITARAERGMNQKQFAEYMGVSQAMVSKWETVDCNFTIQTISKICEKLNLIPRLELLSEEDYMAINKKEQFDLPEKEPGRLTDISDLFNAA